MDKKTHAELSRLTPKQVSALVGAAENPRDRALIAVVYQLGLRRSEVALLSRNLYYPGSNPTIMVTRIKPIRYQHELPLWKTTAKLLDAYLEARTDDNQALFLSRKNKPLGAQAVFYVYKNLAIKTGLPPIQRHPHCLRHSIAVHLIKAGLDIVTIQKALGHTCAESTLYYTHRSIAPEDRNMKLAEGNWNTALIKITENQPLKPQELLPFEIPLEEGEEGK